MPCQIPDKKQFLKHKISQFSSECATQIQTGIMGIYYILWLFLFPLLWLIFKRFKLNSRLWLSFKFSRISKSKKLINLSTVIGYTTGVIELFLQSIQHDSANLFVNMSWRNEKNSDFAKKIENLVEKWVWYLKL